MDTEISTLFAFSTHLETEPGCGLTVLTSSFRAQLPEYILDFGYVILGSIHTHIVKITNTGQFPVSFHANGRVLHDTGK